MVARLRYRVKKISYRELRGRPCGVDLAKFELRNQQKYEQSRKRFLSRGGDEAS